MVAARFATAVEGLPITARELLERLGKEDVADLRRGRIPLNTLRGYAEHFSRLKGGING